MVNKLAIVAGIFAFVSLFLPWWSMSIEALGLSISFNVYPGWFGGDLGNLATAISRIGGSIGWGAFEKTLGSLRTAGCLVGIGAFIAIIGACIKGGAGRGMVALGAILSIVGVFSFYSTWSQLFASAGVPISVSRSITWGGISLAKLSWGWTYGLYLCGFASFLLLIGIATHPSKPSTPSKPVSIRLTPTVPERLIRCNSCGASVPADSDFCPNCGALVVKEAVPKPVVKHEKIPKPSMICPYCGALATQEDEICPNCLMSLKRKNEEGKA